MVIPYLGFLVLLGAERLVELALSRRNAARALARGGVERGRTHFRWMALLHAAFLPACALEALVLGRPFIPSIAAPMLVLALAAQALRYWAVTTLGPSWNVRVIVVPGDPSVRHGPYRYLRHPNYLAVILEGIAVPMLHTAWITAAAFSALNAVLLVIRIRCEEKALAEHCDYTRRLGDRPLLLPRRGHGPRRALETVPHAHPPIGDEGT
jgi:methyltransferase